MMTGKIPVGYESRDCLAPNDQKEEGRDGEKEESPHDRGWLDVSGYPWK